MGDTACEVGSQLNRKLRRLPFKNVLILTRQFQVACVPCLCVCALCVCPVCALCVCKCVCVLCFVVPCLMMVSIAKALTAASDINANKLRQFLAVFFSFFFVWQPKVYNLEWQL